MTVISDVHSTHPDDRPLAALPPRERIRRTASDLFYRRSIHTVGIDRIIAESGVAKMTFYKHFPSKVSLITDYLRSQSGVWIRMLATATERPGLTPVGRVLAIFDALDGFFQDPGFRGCPFVKGLSEFGPEGDTPEIRAMIDGYFESLDALVSGLVAPLDVADPRKTIVQILTLVQGAIVMAQATSDRSIGGAVRDAARMLLEPPSI
ncbi:TetR/AcrR family transcriptional regulator [Sphingomonas sp. Leaf62]|uniref:TetR/AcrR family transcriptional regulator n=1 Tax=Sphingomonas sp. Leaf62 TaxID=1736228 RepID=UPI0006F8B6B4|nr:TetR/AcrR family transcriptional regulator [Sphingomonas sp. Leaf62]KQN69650.1 transcriptional regulator [Sphingomonas sp. Leaf62]